MLSLLQICISPVADVHFVNSTCICCFLFGFAGIFFTPLTKSHGNACSAIVEVLLHYFPGQRTEFVQLLLWAFWSEATAAWVVLHFTSLLPLQFFESEQDGNAHTPLSVDGLQEKQRIICCASMQEGKSWLADCLVVWHGVFDFFFSWLGCHVMTLVRVYYSLFDYFCSCASFAVWWLMFMCVSSNNEVNDSMRSKQAHASRSLLAFVGKISAARRVEAWIQLLFSMSVCFCDIACARCCFLSYPLILICCCAYLAVARTTDLPLDLSDVFLHVMLIRTLKYNPFSE